MRVFRPDIRGLLAHLRSLPPDDETRQQILDDLLFRIADWEENDRLLVLANVGLAYLPDHVYDRYPEARTGMAAPTGASSPRASELDLMVVAIKKAELYAAQMAFGIDPLHPHDDKHNGVRFWRSTCTGAEGQELTMAVCMAGEDGNTRMATFMATVLQRYRPRLCTLIGMSAGMPGEVELGDVVAAEIVVDPSKVRATSSGTYPRSDYESPQHHRDLYRDQMHFDPRKYRWASNIAALLQQAAACEYVDLPTDPMDKFAPHFHTGVVIGGSVLVEDDSLPSRRSDVHDRTRSQEMEGYGFAHACEESNVKWLLWRGIADWGQPDDSGTRPTNWQFTATLATAVAMRLFLRHDYGAETDLSF